MSDENQDPNAEIERLKTRVTNLETAVGDLNDAVRDLNDAVRELRGIRPGQRAAPAPKPRTFNR